jgi:hypothetical protein
VEFSISLNEQNGAYLNHSSESRITTAVLRDIGSKPENVKIVILWSFFIGVMILGGYAVYYRTLGGTAVHYQNSPIQAALASMLFVFGVYLLGLVIHAYLFNQK